MLPPPAIFWLPTALGLAASVLVLALVWRLGTWPGDDGSDEDPGSDGGSGGTRRPRPRRPLPTGPVCWPEFERQFAAYVEHRSASRTAWSADAGRDRRPAAPRAPGGDTAP